MLNRLAPRNAFAFATAAFFVLGTYGVFALRWERADLMSSTEREVRTLAKAVQASVHDAWRDHRSVDVLFQSVERANPMVDLALMRADGTWQLSDDARTELPPDAAIALHAALRGTSQLVSSLDAGAGGMVLAEPVVLDGRIVAAVGVVRDLDDVRADLVRTRDAIAGTVAITLVVLTLVALFVAQALVVRPLDRMLAAFARVSRGDTSARVADVDAAARQDEIGALMRGFNAMVSDLDTARRRLDASQSEHARLSRSLERADRLVTVGQLAAGIAHEIGSPLQVLVIRARSLEKHAADKGEVEKLAHVVVEQVSRISKIVRALLEAGRLRPAEKQRVDLRAPVMAVLELLTFEARRKEVALAIDVADGTPEIVADADQIQQIVLNLVRNALAATPSHGSVTVALAPDILAGQSAVSLYVRDTGEGMTDEVKRHVFEPFFTTKSEGTGLGMPVVRSLVMNHGGTIDVDSAPGRGTLVVVRLPTAPPAVAPGSALVVGTDVSASTLHSGS